MFTHLILISWDHTNTEIAFRDQLVLSQKETAQFYNSVEENPDILEFTILSTCNRMEFYVVTSNPDMIKYWVFTQYHQYSNCSLDFETITPSIFSGKAAVKHLFRVTSGMESMVFGEQQIMQQVQSVSNKILRQNKNSSLLSQLFSTAVRCGKLVRSKTQLGIKDNSMSLESVKNVLTHKPDIRTQNILIIGAGETAELTAQHFIQSGAQHITISNRSEERGRSLAATLYTDYKAFNQIMFLLKDMDIIVTATNSIKHIIKRKDVLSILSEKSQKEILFVDISTPRNIDPDIRNVNGMTLIDIDSLKDQRIEISPRRKLDIAQAEKLVQKQVASYYESWHSKRDLNIIREDCQSNFLDS